MKHQDDTVLTRRVFVRVDGHSGHLDDLAAVVRAMDGSLDQARTVEVGEGYEIREEKDVDVLVIRLENFDDCAAEAFKEFLDIDDWTSVDANLGSRKAYADLYQAFKDSVVFPKAYLDRMYSSRFVQHFYNEEEIEGFRVKWTRDLC